MTCVQEEEQITILALDTEAMETETSATTTDRTAHTASSIVEETSAMTIVTAEETADNSMAHATIRRLTEQRLATTNRTEQQ